MGFVTDLTAGVNECHSVEELLSWLQKDIWAAIEAVVVLNDETVDFVTSFRWSPEKRCGFDGDISWHFESEKPW